MRVLGIDPAPTKGLSVFDGNYRQIPIGQSRKFVANLEREVDLLICWDSPLTGPESLVVDGGNSRVSSFSQRPIESFFSRAATGFRTPPGISVRGYSGCPHWALSRSLIGLPRTGPFDHIEVPFALISEDGRRPYGGRNVVEVHPALAMWLWCKNHRPADASWDYKKDTAVRNDIWSHLHQVPDVTRVLAYVCAEPPSSDDELDARVAYILGRLWIEEPSSVVLLGNLDDGTFLLPRIVGMGEAFQRFVYKMNRER